MNVSLYIAKRYLFSRKSHNVINIISFISLFGIAVSTCAIIVVLSAINGIEHLVDGLYSSFDSEIQITPSQGKTMHLDSIPMEKIRSLENVEQLSPVIQEIVLLNNDEQWLPATIKGVEQAFLEGSGIDSMLVDGRLLLEENGIYYGIFGAGVRYKLGGVIGKSLFAYAPLKDENFKKAEEAFKKARLYPSGVFAIAPDFDNRYVIVSYEFARDILEYGDLITALELSAKPGIGMDDLRDELASLLGPGYQVKTRYQQNELLYKTHQSEKWMTFLILAFILLVAAFNIIASLTMLMLDKKKDIGILRSMGASPKLVRRIFFLEGWLINVFGGLMGLLLGLGICWFQENYGLVRLDGGLIEFYPIKVLGKDVLLVVFTVIIIGALVTYFPVRVLVRRFFSSLRM